MTTPAPVRMSPRRLAHFNLYVSDLKRSTDFYGVRCGVRHIAGEPDVPITFLTNGSSHHELGLVEIHDGPRIGREGFVQGVTAPGQKPGLNHLGWEMENEAVLVAAYDRADAAGLLTRTADHTIAHSVYMVDPDGNHHEFFADTDLDWRSFLVGDLDRMTGRWDPHQAPPSDKINYDRPFSPPAAPGAVLRPARISHGALRTFDLTAMRTFLLEVAGLEEIAFSAGDGHAVFRGAARQGKFDLVVTGGRREGEDALHHMSFLLADLQMVDEALAGLEAVGQPVKRLIDTRDKRGFVIADPDGLLIEFMTPKPAAALASRRDVFELA